MQTVPLETSNGPLVDCYNCRGQNTRIMCGMLQFGCALCEICGDGQGHIYSKYRTIPVTIGEHTFTPPTCSCLWCQDTKKALYSIWDPELEDSGCSDRGAHNMPKVEVACRACMKNEHEVEYENAKTNYFNSKVKICSQCQNTKRAKYIIFDPALKSDSWSDHGAHNMPQVEIACRVCLPTEHQTEYNNAKLSYFMSKTKN